MIVSSVGTALQHHLILSDGTDALTLRTTEALSYTMENDYASFVTNIMFTMDYAVTLTDLATPVAATDVTLTVDESQPVTYIS
jgi:hypothetical protein